MLKIKASKEIQWAHNYCLLIYTKSNNASESIHFNIKLDTFKVNILVKRKVKDICNICKNKKMLESLFKVS